MNTWIRFYIWLSAMAATLFLLATPMPEYQGDIETYYDKVGHFLIFAVLAALSYWWLRVFKNLSLQFTLVLSGLIAILYAALTELIQAYVPGRTQSELDFAAGFIGACLVIIIIYVRERRKT